MKKLLCLSLTVCALGSFSTSSFAFSTADLIKSHCAAQSVFSDEKSSHCVQIAVKNIDFYLKRLDESSNFVQKGNPQLAKAYILDLNKRVLAQYKLVDLKALNLLPMDVIEEKKELKLQLEALKAAIDSGNKKEFLAVKSNVRSDLVNIQFELKTR